MSDWNRGGGTSLRLPTPGRALRGVLLSLLAIWLMFAMALNWADADPGIFLGLAGSVEGILAGQVWRLFTAPFIHSPDDPWHVVAVLLGLYFLTPSLEERWGQGRLLWFLGGSAFLAYFVQFLVLWAAPPELSAKLCQRGIWFGATPVVEAVAVAWALNFRGQTVRLAFVLPVTTRGLLIFVIGFSLLRLIAAQQVPEGLVAPFGGLGAGWLLGGGTPSPLRRAYLKLRYRQIAKEVDRSRKQRSSRVRRAPFSVIEGGRGKSDDDDEKPPGGYLN